MLFFISKNVTLRLWWTDYNRLTVERKQYQKLLPSLYKKYIGTQRKTLRSRSEHEPLNKFAFFGLNTAANKMGFSSFSLAWFRWSLTFWQQTVEKENDSNTKVGALIGPDSRSEQRLETLHESYITLLAIENFWVLYWAWNLGGPIKLE